MEYWTVHQTEACRFGFLCRECHKSINKGETIMIRDGRRIRLMYHMHCFSGSADPRTQKGSSYNAGRLPRSAFSSSAPPTKYKMRV